MIRKLACCAALFAAAALPALADEGDPPSRVARLNYETGSVSFRPGSVDEWTDATLNYPLTTGDHLWTEPGARTELHVGSTAIRMSSATAFSILNLDDRIAQFSVTTGTVNLRVRDLDPDETYEIDTPNAAIALLRPGDYRIDVDEDNNVTTVTVWDGETDVTAGGSTFPVRMRESARISGDDGATRDIGPVPPRREFDEWCEARSRREDRSQSVRYVSRETTGYEDLDDYGTWQTVAPYGSVWVPAGMPGDWAPYHYGHWAWVDPWGWTWIDDAPWGFAPFHYGRWAYAGFGWVWVPGTIAPRPVYAPALVAFIGGPRFGVTVALGGDVAWFPLGPGEAYRPGYRYSQAYLRRVNMGRPLDIDVVNVRYVNRGVRGAVIAVHRDVFVGARPVGRSRIAVDAREIERVQVLGAYAPVPPSRVSVLGRAEPRRIGGPPARYADRVVVVRTAPPPPRVSFRVQERALEANPGRPLDAGALNDLRRGAPDRGPTVRVVPASPRTNPRNGGFVRPAPAPRAVEPRNEPRRMEERPVPQRTVEPWNEPRRVEERPVPQRTVEPRNRGPFGGAPPSRRDAQPQQRQEQPRQEPRRVEQPRNERPAPEARREAAPEREKERGNGRDGRRPDR